MSHNGVNKLLARIPIEVYERSVHEQWDEGDWARWLNSSEAAPFRIWSGECNGELDCRRGQAARRAAQDAGRAEGKRDTGPEVAPRRPRPAAR